MYPTRALTGLIPVPLDQSVETRKISRHLLTEVCVARPILLFYEGNSYCCCALGYCDANTWYIARLSSTKEMLNEVAWLFLSRQSCLIDYGVYFLKLVSNWLLMIYGRIAHFINVWMKLTAFHTWLLYKRNTKWIYVLLDIQWLKLLECFSTLEEQKTHA